jgi:hypothetical protein
MYMNSCLYINMYLSYKHNIVCSLIRIHAILLQVENPIANSMGILIRLRGCAGWFGSMLVANPLCWFCRDAAQTILSSFIRFYHRHKCQKWYQSALLAKIRLIMYNYTKLKYEKKYIGIFMMFVLVYCYSF